MRYMEWRRKFCHNEKLPLSLLLPLIENTLLKIKTISPAEAQTGPAKRKDTKTIEKHLQMLEDKPQLQELYKKLSALITSH